MSVLRREVDAYQRALEAYRRRYAALVREQNAALQNLQQGNQRYLVPTEQEGQYLIANRIDDRGNFTFDTRKTGGILGIGRQTVPVVVGSDGGYQVLPEGPTEAVLGPVPQEPTASMAQARAASQPSLAQFEAGLIGEVLRGKGLRYSDSWRAPLSVAQQMERAAALERIRLEDEQRRRLNEPEPPGEVFHGY